MKRTILLCLFIGTTMMLSAQDAETVQDQESRIPVSGAWGVTMNVTDMRTAFQLTPRIDLLGNSLLMGRYVKSEKLTYRLGISPNIYRMNVLRTDSVGKDLVEFDSTARQASVSVLPGIEFHMVSSKRLDPYISVDAIVGRVGGTSIGSVTNTTDTTGTSRVVRTITEAGGFNVGARVGFGMNYFVDRHFSIGLEYGFGAYNVVTGGDRQEVIQIEPVSGTNTTIRNLSSARTSDFRLSVDPMVRLTLSYFFRT